MSSPLQRTLIEFFMRQLDGRAVPSRFSALRAIHWGERIDLPNDGPEGALCTAIDRGRRMDPEDRRIESALQCLTQEHRDFVLFLCSVPDPHHKDQFNFAHAATRWKTYRWDEHDTDTLRRAFSRRWQKISVLLSRLLDLPITRKEQA